MAQSTNARPTNKLDWASHESTIRRLYIEESKPLEGREGVMDIMSSLHQFSATWVLLPLLGEGAD